MDNALSVLSSRFYAASNQGSIDAKRKLLSDLATNVGAHDGLPQFPLNQVIVKGVVASLLAAGYRSADDYLGEL